MQWPKEQGQNDKQRSTKHYTETKYQATRTPPTKNRGWNRVVWIVSSSCWTIGVRRVTLVPNPVISHA